MIARYIKMPGFWFILIAIGIVVTIVTFTESTFKERWGRHEELALKATNSGSNKIYVNAIVLGEYEFTPGLVGVGKGATALISNNTITEYVTVYWQIWKSDKQFTKKINLWEIVPEDIEGEYLTLIFDINSDTNEVKVTYEIDDIPDK